MYTYTYLNYPVFIALTSDMEGVTPIDTCGDFGIFPAFAHNGCDTYRTEDDAYAGNDPNGEEIVVASCINPENDQCLLDGIYTKRYALLDKIEQQLVVKTGDYHEWTSERARFESELWDAHEGYITEDEAEKYKAQWSETVREYIPNGTCPELDIPTFEDLLKSAGVVVKTKFEELCDSEGYSYSTTIRDAISRALAQSNKTAATVSQQTGVAESSISRYINGKEGLGIDKIETLIKYLHITLVW